MGCVYACNQFVDEQAPWALKKTNLTQMKAVLATLYGCIRDLSIAILPIIPESAGRLLDSMGIAESKRNYTALIDVDWYDRLCASGFRLAAPTPIFPRLEMPSEESI